MYFVVIERKKKNFIKKKKSEPEIKLILSTFISP